MLSGLILTTGSNFFQKRLEELGKLRKYSPNLNKEFRVETDINLTAEFNLSVYPIDIKQRKWRQNDTTIYILLNRHLQK